MRSRCLSAGAGLWILLATGCFREVKEQVTEDSVACIVVQGTGDPVDVSIDGVLVAKDLELVEENGVRLKVTHGARRVTVVRGDRTLVERQVYVGDGETRIIVVPRG